MFEAEPVRGRGSPTRLDALRFAESKGELISPVEDVRAIGI